MADTVIFTSSPPVWKDLAEVTCKAMKDYADRHGYHFYGDVSDLRDSYFDPHTKTVERIEIRGFVKMSLFLYLLPKYKRVVWLDSDLLITRPDISIDELTYGATEDLIIPYEHNGINATVIIMRSNDLTYDFTWACENTGRKLYLFHDWKEMQSMRYFLMTPPYDKMVKYISAKRLCPILHEEYIAAGLPARVSQKYGYEDGDWAIHFSALTLERRVQLAREYYARVYGA